MSITYKLKKIATCLRKKYGKHFDIEKTKFEDLTESQAKDRKSTRLNSSHT